MPRIEIIPEDLSKGDASPTVDVCRLCAPQFTEGEPAPAFVYPEVRRDLNPEFGGLKVGSTDVDHPPFEDNQHMYPECACCGAKLDVLDN